MLVLERMWWATALGGFQYSRSGGLKSVVDARMGNLGGGQDIYM